MLIYLGLFALGFVFVLASAVLADVFDSGEVDPGGGDIALVSVFSPRIVAAATAGFGAGGALGLMLGLPDSASIVTALVGAALVAGAVYAFLLVLVRQQGNTLTVRDGLVGGVATVVTLIPVGAVGEVSMITGGQLSVYLARSSDAAELRAGTQVQVTGMAGDALLVSATGDAAGPHPAGRME